MKRQIYDLTDEPFAVFTNKVGSVLKAEGILYNIVGGVATQAYILDMLTGKYGKSVTELVEDEEVRIQDYVRRTDDIDVSLSLEGDDREKIRRITTIILPQFSFETVSPSEESIFKFKVERMGASRPKFKVYVDDQGSEDDVIAMNIGRNQKDIRRLDFHWYDEFLSQGKELVVPYLDGFDIRTRVPRLEHLLASKIAPSRAKDLMDNKNLATLAKETGIKLDFKEIEKVLMPNHEDNLYRFLNAEYPEQVR